MRSLGTAVALLACIPHESAGKDGMRLVCGAKCALSFEGDSTLHRYSVAATKVTVAGGLDAPPGAPLRDALLRGKGARLEVTIPVSGLKSGDQGLDENMVDALKGGKNPEIRFRLTGVQVSEGTSPDSLRMRAKGRLAVAGSEKEIAVDADGLLRDRTLVVRGDKTLVMSEFGIEPPTMLLGLLKTDDEVAVHYELELEMR